MEGMGETEYCMRGLTHNPTDHIYIMHAAIVKHPSGYLKEIYVYGWHGVATCCLDDVNFTKVIVFDSVGHGANSRIESSVEGAE